MWFVTNNGSFMFLCLFTIYAPARYSVTYMNSVPQASDKISIPSSLSKTQLTSSFFQSYLHYIGEGEAEY